jgi:hypothetical protein
MIPSLVEALGYCRGEEFSKDCGFGYKVGYASNSNVDCPWRWGGFEFADLSTKHAPSATIVPSVLRKDLTFSPLLL